MKPEEGPGALAARGAIGGVLMGLANLVPGVSGGTMLLATGIYTRFIDAVAQVSTLRFRRRSLLLLASVGAAALVAVVALAGPVKSLVATYRWLTYATFIGLTLGGVPLVARMARPFTPAVAGGALAGFALMAAMVFVRPDGAAASGAVVLFVAGVAGAITMILPGVSGAYLFLVLGQYETLLGALADLRRGDWGAFEVLVPVGLGVAVGVAGVSNLVRWTLRRYEKATLGLLLGLLFGSILGIWPFQTAPLVVYYAPSPTQAAAALLLAAGGFWATRALGRLGAGSK